MKIMDYSQMLENANAVKILVNKTIECSKDYTDSQKDNVVEQMIEYMYKTLRGIMHFGINERRMIISYIMKYIRGTFAVDTSDYLINGLTGKIRIKFDRFDGDRIEVYLKENEYWFEYECISDKGLKYLIKYWDEIKEGIHAGIKEGIDMINKEQENKLQQQLALHKAIKNFKI